MKVLDLRCAQGHGFEGWFASSDDFESQLARGLVECPMCGDRAVVKLLSAPRLNFGGSGAEPPSAVAIVPAQDSPEARWLRAMRKVVAETEDVGERFADEARRIHHGRAPERGIRGQATADQTEALRDEGIAVMALALPAALKETLQ